MERKSKYLNISVATTPHLRHEDRPGMFSEIVLLQCTYVAFLMLKNGKIYMPTYCGLVKEITNDQFLCQLIVVLSYVSTIIYCVLKFLPLNI